MFIIYVGKYIFVCFWNGKSFELAVYKCFLIAFCSMLCGAMLVQQSSILNTCLRAKRTGAGVEMAGQWEETCRTHGILPT